MATMKAPPTESSTRQKIIDQQLARAGWGLWSRTMVEEYLVSVSEKKEEYGHQHGFGDYALLGRDGRPIAIVEAKRSGRDAVAGKKQAAEYANDIKSRIRQ